MVAEVEVSLADFWVTPASLLKGEAYFLSGDQPRLRRGWCSFHMLPQRRCGPPFGGFPLPGHLPRGVGVCVWPRAGGHLGARVDKATTAWTRKPVTKPPKPGHFIPAHV